MIDMDAKEVVSAIKTSNLNARIFFEKTMIILVFEINNSNIHTAMILINQDIMILF